jgi:ACS family tartrate transporter-like MFS transporter
LGINAYVYGWGAGIFFFSYFLFEIPSNLILERVGARIWIARIMLTWGIISGLTVFATRGVYASHQDFCRAASARLRQRVRAPTA